MANDRIYPKGIRTFAKNEKAPEWVLGKLIITLSEFKEWVSGEGKQYLTKYQEKDQLTLQVTTGKDGRIQLSVDTFKPTKKNESEDEKPY